MYIRAFASLMPGRIAYHTFFHLSTMLSTLINSALCIARGQCICGAVGTYGYIAVCHIGVVRICVWCICGPIGAIWCVPVAHIHARNV